MNSVLAPSISHVGSFTSVYARVIGVDVAADKIDVNDSDCKIVNTMPNTVVAIMRQFVAKIKLKADTLVVCEATGGYEHVFVDAKSWVCFLRNKIG